MRKPIHTNPVVLAILTISLLPGCATRPKPQIELRLGTSTATPEVVSPGEIVQITSSYSLRIPFSPNIAEVRDSYVLKKDGKVLFASDPHLEQHPSGEYAINAEIPIPTIAEPGTYIVETKVKTGPYFDMRPVTFVVEKTQPAVPARRSRNRSRHR